MANLQSIQTNDSGFLGLPQGTTNQRPDTPLAGMARYNTDLSVIEFYDGTGWRNNSVGSQPSEAILDFATIPQNFKGGPIYINPALAAGTGDRPFLVQTELDSQGEPFVKMQVAAENGAYSASPYNGNDIDKAGGADLGTLYDIGPVSLITNTTHFFTDPADTSYYHREFVEVDYFNFATGSNFTPQQVTDLSRWANQTSEQSYQIILVVDDDDEHITDLTFSSLYTGTNIDSDITSPNLGHPVYLHTADSNGTILGYDGTNTGGFNQNNTEVFLLNRGMGNGSNDILGFRWNTAEQDFFYNEGGFILRGDQNEPLDSRFVVPKYVSLATHTGGGNSWSYRTYESTANNVTQNFFLVKGTGYL